MIIRMSKLELMLFRAKRKTKYLPLGSNLEPFDDEASFPRSITISVVDDMVSHLYVTRYRAFGSFPLSEYRRVVYKKDDLDLLVLIGRNYDPCVETRTDGVSEENGMVVSTVGAG